MKGWLREREVCRVERERERPDLERVDRDAGTRAPRRSRLASFVAAARGRRPQQRVEALAQRTRSLVLLARRGLLTGLRRLSEERRVCERLSQRNTTLSLGPSLGKDLVSRLGSAREARHGVEDLALAQRSLRARHHHLQPCGSTKLFRAKVHSREREERVKVPVLAFAGACRVRPARARASRTDRA